MLDTIRARYPGLVALRTIADLDKYETAIESFEGGGSRSELKATLFGLGIPADQIRLLASYPGQTLPAMCAEPVLSAAACGSLRSATARDVKSIFTLSAVWCLERCRVRRSF